MKAINTTTLVLFASLIVVIITGMMLHVDVNHHHIAGFTILTYLHLAAVIVMGWLSYLHLAKHSKWFNAYRKLRWSKKIVNTLMSITGIAVVVTGVLILFSVRHELSIAHYFTGILFTLLALGHSIKRIARTLKNISA